jgi:hypothetical protein
MIAAVSAVLLLLVMFIFDWFSVDFGDDELGLGAAAVDVGANAWQAFSFIDLLLFVTILVAIGVAVMSANSQSVNLPVAGTALVAGLGILSFLFVLYRVIDPPGSGDIPDGFDIGINRDLGVWLGLILTAGIAYGGWQGMQEEGTSFSDQADRVQSRTGSGGGGEGGPPPPPPRDPGGGPPPAQ